jgi:putative ABC transport system permease protein
LAQGIERGFDAQSREILGADFTVDARRPLPEALDEALAAVPELERSDTVETMSMVSTGAGRSRLAQVFAVRGRYPLYGALATQPAGGLAAFLTDDAIVAEPDLLSALGLSIGDTLRIGTSSFRVAASGEGGPQPGGFSSFLAPRLYISMSAFQTTGLMGFGSRIRYRTLCAFPDEVSKERLDEIIDSIEAAVPDAPYLDFDAHHEIGRGRRWVGRLEGFAGLVALLSLVIGGIGVALIVRTWLARRTQAMAVMRCIGVRPRQLLWLSLGHTALLALIGSLVGAALGCALPPLARAWVPDLLPVQVATVFPTDAVLRGLVLGVGLALAFALPALAAIWRVSPARALRADAEPLPPHKPVRIAAALFLTVAVLGSAWVQAEKPLYALWFTGGLLALTGLLYAAARALVWAAGRLPRTRLSPYLVHGFSALARPGAGTAGIIVALGLGTMVVTAIGLVEVRLREALLARIPTTAPSVFLVDIQPDQREGVQAELTRAGAQEIDLVPVVMARIAAIDGRSVQEIAKDEGGSSWSLTREQRLTWRAQLTEDNQITSGALWSKPDLPEVSVEQSFARRLGVDLGSTIRFDVQGIPVTFHVTSIRSVEWQSLSLNFFLIVEPGVLEDAPALYVASAQVPEAAEGTLQDRLAVAFGGITVLRVRAILEQVLALMNRVVLGLRVLGLLTVLAGLAILAGAVSASVLHRGREVALLKTLGVTRGGVTALLLTEYGLCGALAGLLGAGGALLLAWTWLEFIAEIDVRLPLWILPLAMVGIGLLTAACGVFANLRALRVRPSAVLR